MKKTCLTLLLLASMLVSGRAQFFGPEAWSGALLGSFLGGIAGSDCHHGFSGTGAAIGAGAGFAIGALAGEVNRRSAYNSGTTYYQPVAYAQPGYGYVYAPAPVSPPPPMPMPPKSTVKPASKSHFPAASPRALPQIPDAPRVPDAPTF